MSVECIAVSILALPPCWHVAGVKARKYVTEARLSVGRMLNCDAEGKRIISYGRKFWQGIYFGGLAVLRAICQYFFSQNLCNHIVYPLNKPGCARPID